MGMTMIEKILQNHTSEEVKPGGIVWIDLDIRSARDFAGASVVKNFDRHFPGDRVADPSKTFFTFDCNVPAKSIAYAENQQTCREFAKRQEVKVYDVDAGIGSHIMLYEGLALPGGTVVGTDSHLNIMGAVGCFGQGMGDSDIAFGFRTGRTWFEVPETVKITLKGNYQYPTTAKDLILYILKHTGASGALGMCVELYGDTVDRLTLPERITIASMGTEMGAISIMIPPGEEIVNYYKKLGKTFTPVYADPSAHYVKEMTIDVEGLAPQIAQPPNPENVTAVSDVGDVKVDSVFIGSCTNGTYEDIRMASEIMKGKKIAPWVMAKVVPSTREVYGRLLQEGIIADLFESGVIISCSGCGGCAEGQIGMTGKGEVQISTSNRNFKGKQGGGLTYLASPVTASVSALTGKITSPTKTLVSTGRR